MSTELTTTGGNSLTIPTDPKEFKTFITVAQKAMEAAKARSKKPNISIEEFEWFHNQAKELGFMALDAALNLSIAINNIPTSSGQRTDLEPLSTEETGSDEETRTKEKILKEDFGMTETQAWRIAQLTDEAVRKEKEHADANDEPPSISHALSYVISKDKAT